MVAQDTDYSPIVEILEDILGDYRLHNDHRGQISFDCPVCSYEIKVLDRGDGKGNLEVNYKQNVYKCWVCAETHDTHGSLFKLVKKFGTPKQYKNFVLLKPDYDENDNRPKYKKVRLPKEYIPFKNPTLGLKLTPHYKQAYNYIKGRNITNEIIEKYDIGFCYQGEYENRIIIPSYDSEGEINYFIARSYLSKTKMKYKNPQVDKESLIWNEDKINWDRRVYIVEGAFDSVFLPNSIPMLGKFITKKLYDTLYDNAKEIVIVLDGDAWEDAIKLYHKLNCGKLMGKIWIVRLPIEKDIADLQGDLSNFEIKQLD
jgi:DNA primase